MKDILTILLQASLQAFMPVIVVTCVTWCITKIMWIANYLKETKPNVYYAVVDFCNIAVRSAEQIYGEGRGEEKKAYAMNVVSKFLQAKGVKLDLECISAAIEAAVREMNLQNGTEVKDPDEDTDYAVSSAL